MNRIVRFSFILLVLVACPQMALCQEEDLIVLGRGKYFTVYGPPDFHSHMLVAKLNFDYQPHPEEFLGENGPYDDNITTKTFDALFREISDLLDIHTYNFHGAIKLLANQGDVSRTFAKYFKRDFGERSFYVPETNTIYISSADATLGMIGHEIAHAIMANYFVVPPSTKIQEVLAGYVEYSLRKAAGTLPKK